MDGSGKRVIAIGALASVWLSVAWALHGASWAFVASFAVLFAGGTLIASFGSGWAVLDRWPNRVTAVRFSLVAWVAGGWLGEWSVALWAFSLLALGLDGVDGWLARRLDQSSRFGARFDMEVDAFFIMVLSLLCWRLTDAGPWVLAMGALRYLWVGASWPAPALTTPLPPSVFRKTVCVVQLLALLYALLPGGAVPYGVVVLAVSLGLLFVSFARDAIWCFFRAPHTATVAVLKRP